MEIKISSGPQRDPNTGIGSVNAEVAGTRAAEAAYDVWRMGDGSGLEIVQSNRHWGRYPHHLHQALEIIWIHSDKAEFICRGAACTLEAGEACIISPNECHGGGSVGDSPLEFTLIHVPIAMLEHKILRHINSSAASSSSNIVSAAVAGAVLPQLMGVLKNATRGQQCQRKLTRALTRLFTSISNKRSRIFGVTQTHPAVNRIKSILCANYAEQIDIESLASEVHMNSRYLISLFKAKTGVSPHQFQIGIRVDLARRLIQSDTPHSVAAVSTGFSDQSHLSRHFKRQYGVTPGAFRRLAKAV